MKKILKMTAFLLIFASLFTVVSCGTTIIENSGSDTSSSTLIPNENTNTQNNTTTNNNNNHNNNNNNNNNNSTDGNKETLGNILINNPNGISNKAPTRNENGEYPISGYILSASAVNDSNGNGMSVIYRLSDGSFLIYDGGNESVYSLLYKTLKDLSEGGDIVISAWVMTHGHGDHYGALRRMALEGYSHDVTIKEIWMNPTSNSEDVFLYNQLKSDFPKTNVRSLVYGEKFMLDKIHVEVLCTPEVLPNRSDNTRNTMSIVTMLTIDGKKFLMTGDSDEPAWEYMVTKHNEHSLKCDYLQVPHHGVFWAGTAEAYALMDPSHIIVPSTVENVNLYAIDTRAKPTQDLYKKFGLTAGQIYKETDNKTYWFAGVYGAFATENVKCFFTSDK